MILAGDLGGTKANLGLFEIRAGKLANVCTKRYATQEHKGLEEVITDFLTETKGTVTAASFGIAGPVVQNRVHATNFPWIVDGASLAEHLGVSRVRLLNDLEAAAYGIGVMEPPDLEVIHPGVFVPRANRAVIAAGTGLGEAILFWDGDAARSDGHRKRSRGFCATHKSTGQAVGILEAERRVRERRNDFVGRRIQARARISRSVGAA